MNKDPQKGGWDAHLTQKEARNLLFCYYTNKEKKRRRTRKRAL
jgi:hypothetical protein